MNKIHNLVYNRDVVLPAKRVVLELVKAPKDVKAVPKLTFVHESESDAPEVQHGKGGGFGVDDYNHPTLVSSSGSETDKEKVGEDFIKIMLARLNYVQNGRMPFPSSDFEIAIQLQDKVMS